LQVWEQLFGVNIIDAANQQIYDASKLADQLVMASKAVKRVGFIGLGAMGFGMASHLLKSGFSVTAFDVGTYTYYSLLHNLPFELLQIKYKK
jgi:phosphoglycerate dehydrogenase-like enzyme